MLSRSPRRCPTTRSTAATTLAQHRDQIGFPAETLSEVRILDEVQATGGDIRRICELFDVGVEAALRDTNVLGRPDLR